MPLFAWRDSFSVRDATLDSQHKKLVELLNQLYDAMTCREGKSVVDAVLAELVDYAATHFAEEEQLMRACHYSGLAKHKQAHDAFAQQAAAFVIQYNAGSVSVSRDLLRALKECLVNHIEKMDQGYADALQQIAA
jgi:hemerythrin